MVNERVPQETEDGTGNQVRIYTRFKMVISNSKK